MLPASSIFSLLHTFSGSSPKTLFPLFAIPCPLSGAKQNLKESTRSGSGSTFNLEIPPRWQKKTLLVGCESNTILFSNPAGLPQCRGQIRILNEAELFCLELEDVMYWGILWPNAIIPCWTNAMRTLSDPDQKVSVLHSEIFPFDCFLSWAWSCVEQNVLRPGDRSGTCLRKYKN